MNNELLESYVGRECILNLGTLGTSVKGTILSVRDNWLEIQTKKEIRLINADYISSIQLQKA